MAVSIISNTAAMSAQTNLERATGESQSSISRLSSGNRIAAASDDVAGLAVGTILKSNVTTLNAALQTTAQAQSLLGVADGALSGIGDILQRQKALASQATSGSLSDQARSFLNLEYQNLTKQIDQIAANTNFNGIKLIDGSLYAPNKLESSTLLDATRASGAITIGTAATGAETLTINGIVITFRTAATMTAGTPELNIDVGANNTQALQAAAVKTLIDNLKNYQGTTAGVLTAKAAAQQIEVSSSGAIVTVTSKAAGTVGNSIQAAIAIGGGALVGTLNGTGLTAAANITSGTTGVAAIDGSLNAGAFSATTEAYGGSARVVAQGSVSDTILRALTTTAVATTGINLANVSHNKDFIGKIQGFEAEYVASNTVNLSIKVGDYTYIARNVNTNYAANTIVTLSSVETGGGSFNIQFAASQGESSVTDQSKANLFATRVNKAFEGIEVYQRRKIDSYVPAGTVYPTGSTTASGNLSGSKFQLLGTNFNDVKIEKVTVRAPVLGTTEAFISFVINGEEYISGKDFDGSTLALGNSITNASGTMTGSDDGTIGFASTANPKNLLLFQYTSATTLSITNDAEAEGLQKALENALGINTGASAVTFQVGTVSSDSIAVQIQDVSAKSIYKDKDNIYTATDISTQAGSTEANKILDIAQNYVTAVRANVGALQSRVKYATNNIQAAIQNQDAARAVFLDTNVSVESSSFAQSQVRVQASISVLAQANQLPQSLLKLIG